MTRSRATRELNGTMMGMRDNDGNEERIHLLINIDQYDDDVCPRRSDVHKHFLEGEEVHLFKKEELPPKRQICSSLTPDTKP